MFEENNTFRHSNEPTLEELEQILSNFRARVGEAGLMDFLKTNGIIRQDVSEALSTPPEPDIDKPIIFETDKIKEVVKPQPKSNLTFEQLDQLDEGEWEEKPENSFVSYNSQAVAHNYNSPPRVRYYRVVSF